MRSRSLFFLFIGIILVLGFCWIVILNYFSNIAEKISQNIWNVLSLIVLLFTALFIAIQAFYTRRVAEFSAMPSVAFDIKSGKTYFYELYRKILLDPKAPEKINDSTIPLSHLLYTRLFIKNISKFPIYFWIKINIKVIYINRNTVSIPINPTMHGPWIINPEITASFPRGDMLSKVILEKNYEKIEEEGDKEVFNQKIKEIQEIVASFKISYAPLVQIGLKFKLKPIKWRFNLNEKVWLDPQGTKDYNIKVL